MIINCKGLNYSYKTYKKKYGFKGTLSDFFSRKYSLLPAVIDFELQVTPGEIVALLGSNGAGKTTLIKMLVGILEPTSGDIECLSFEPFKRDEAFLSNIGVLFGQKSQLIWDLPPIDTLKELQEIYKVPLDIFEESIEEMTKLLNISEYLNTPTRKLSLGQRTKFDIVCSLFYRPQVVFLDEPTIGLDVTSQHEIHKFLLQMNQKFKTTIILTSHNTKDITTLAERVVVIKGGKKYEDCSMEQFMKIFNNSESYIMKTRDGNEPRVVGGNHKIVPIGKGEYKVTIVSSNTYPHVDLTNIEYIKEDSLSLEDILIRIFNEE